MDADARRRAIHQLVEEWLTLPDHRATDFTTLEARLDRFVADAVAQAVKERDARLRLYESEMQKAADQAREDEAKNDEQAEEIARRRLTALDNLVALLVAANEAHTDP